MGMERKVMRFCWWSWSGEGLPGEVGHRRTERQWFLRSLKEGRKREGEVAGDAREREKGARVSQGAASVGIKGGAGGEEVVADIDRGGFMHLSCS
jgi:hypothetical protein